MKFSVTVVLKKDVLDPQGKVVQNTLNNLGMSDIKSVRQGKFFEKDRQKDIIHQTSVNKLTQEITFLKETSVI